MGSSATEGGPFLVFARFRSGLEGQWLIIVWGGGVHPLCGEGREKLSLCVHCERVSKACGRLLRQWTKLVFPRDTKRLRMFFVT